jgi:hypothetical protein
MLSATALRRSGKPRAILSPQPTSTVIGSVVHRASLHSSSSWYFARQLIGSSKAVFLKGCKCR